MIWWGRQPKEILYYEAHFPGIFFTCFYEKVNISGCSQIPVVDNRVTSNQQILNGVGVQEGYKLLMVGQESSHIHG